MRYFILGALGYPALELIWRGRSHPSMALAGGLSAMLIHRIGKTNRSIVQQTLLCGAGITCVEACCGLVWNRRHKVWDYRSMPMNWKGQVCLPYSLVWCGLAAVLIRLDKAYFRT